MDLRAAELIDPAIEGHYALYSFVEQISTKEHYHDFYEVFLISAGSIYHHVNGEAVLLPENTLVFIRPADVHFYQPDAAQNCELVNLAFLRQNADTLFAYFGLPTEQNPLLTTPQPPAVILSRSEAQQLRRRLKDWSRLAYQRPQDARLALRSLLAQTVARLLLSSTEPTPDDIPVWLIDVCQQMRRENNFVVGRDTLIRLSNRSPEYVGRMFKKHLNTTPSQFVNDLRLDYASELLLHTDHPVTEIGYEVGFDNLSYFYRLFKARTGCAPNQFRRRNQRGLIP